MILISQPWYSIITSWFAFVQGILKYDTLHLYYNFSSRLRKACAPAYDLAIHVRFQCYIYAFHLSINSNVIRKWNSISNRGASSLQHYKSHWGECVDCVVLTTWKHVAYIVHWFPSWKCYDTWSFVLTFVRIVRVLKYNKYHLELWSLW